MSSEEAVVLELMTAAAGALKSGHRDDLPATLTRITHAAVQTLPDVDYASFSFLRTDGRLETAAATDPVALKLDASQYELREGPCYEAVTEAGVVQSQQVSDDPRWPRYGPVAARAGVGSQLALEVYRNHHSRGGLNLYSRQTGAFSYQDHLGELFGKYAAVVMSYAFQVETLQQALATRKTIGQALGILMLRYDMSEQRAFATLVRISQHSNVKLRIVAEQVVSNRGLPADPTV